MIRLLLLLLLLLPACTGVSTLYQARCVHPGSTSQFTYRGFNTATLQGDNTLALTNKNTVVYYAIPTGSACRVAPMENNNNNE